MRSPRPTHLLAEAVLFQQRQAYAAALRSSAALSRLIDGHAALAYGFRGRLVAPEVV